MQFASLEIGNLICCGCNNECKVDDFIKIEKSTLLVLKTCRKCRNDEGKVCTECNEHKLLSQYHKYRRGKYYRSICICCERKKHNQKYKKKRAVPIVVVDEEYDDPKEYRKAYYRKYYHVKKAQKELEEQLSQEQLETQEIV